MPNRKYAASSLYRYGFNEKENDNEVKGEGNELDYGKRIQDPRIGRFLSLDPLSKSFPWYSPYQYAGNKPVWASDLDGMEEWMKSQEILLRQRAQIQFQSAESQKMQANQRAAEALARLPAFRQSDDSYYAQMRSRDFAFQNWRNKVYEDAEGFNPATSGTSFGLANTTVQTLKSPIDHSFGIYYGIKDGDYGRAAKNAAFLGLDALAFVPFKGTGAAVSNADKIFSLSIETRGFAEDFALTTSQYKGFLNANKVIQPNNPTFDLFDKSMNVVDVTTTSAKTLNAGQFYTKLSNLAGLDASFGNRTLQIYVKNGQYTTEQLNSLASKLDRFISDYTRAGEAGFGQTNFKITQIK